VNNLIKIEKNIPIFPKSSIEQETIKKMEIGDSIYFEGKFLASTEVQRFARAFKKAGYKYTSRQIYEDEPSRTRKSIGVRLWRTE